MYRCLKWSKKEARSLPQSEVERCRWYRPGKSKCARSPNRCNMAPLEAIRYMGLHYTSRYKNYIGDYGFSSPV